MGGLQRGPASMTATMLMLVVTFVVASTTALAFTGVLEDAQTQNPVVAFGVDVSDEYVVIRHEQGDAVEVAALELVVRHPGGVERVAFTSFADDAGPELPAGDSVIRNEGIPPDTLQLRIVFDGETVLYKRTRA